MNRLLGYLVGMWVEQVTRYLAEYVVGGLEGVWVEQVTN